MPAALLSRLFDSLVALFGVTCLVFLLIHLIPGDPVEVMLGEQARVADREALRQALGLDQPLWSQFGSFLGGLAQLDLGRSLHSQRPVVELLGERLPATLELSLAAFVFAVVISLLLGAFAARHHDRWPDHIASGGALLAHAVPNFWLGPLLVLVFAIWLNWLPVSGRDWPGALILPAFTLGASMAAVGTRMWRASLIDQLNEQYVRTARAKGLDERGVLWHHVARNAALPMTTLLGLQLGALLAGAVITEEVFAWPGVGSLLMDAIRQRDYPVVQGCVLLISVSYVLINLLTDLLYIWLDPRLRR